MSKYVCDIAQERSNMEERFAKVKVVKPYKDMEKMILYQEEDVGAEHEEKYSRAKELEKAGVVKIIDEKKREPPSEA